MGSGEWGIGNGEWGRLDAWTLGRLDAWTLKKNYYPLPITHYPLPVPNP
ncbi:hypothetical protein NIES4075_12130 [Tolypothrix sp. NIES-4075]|nr:hypothetical protein [Tolypothrix sp. NIES-4075]GAX40250.1 hypothetical protein NIES4075_12130 [Tolypothrix sp. NIES-4075]